MSAPAAIDSADSPGVPRAESIDRVYFPELDGLRFVAFMMVYLFHEGVPAELLVRLIGHAPARALLQNGGFGVQFFFILSGYLITALLLREEARYGRIAIRAFWVRRILRIWPLYYLIVAIGFLLLPAFIGDFGTAPYFYLMSTHFPAFLAFLGNWTMALVSPVQYAWISILWSVCVEEQFYLMVPLLFVFVAPRYRRVLVTVLMVVSIVVRAICASHYSSQLMIVYNTFAQLDTLLSGVLLALVLGWNRDRPGLKPWLRWLQWPLYGAIAWLMSLPALGHGSLLHRTWDPVWFWLCGVGVVIVAVWGQGWLRAVLSYSRLVWLGKISYGLYMYHEFALRAYTSIFFELDFFPNKDILLTIATFALTVAMAAASYYGYERWFLLKKRAWTRVPSRPV
jgi:peptidoglycan/LPS O-acetylase OafA/YrhL